MLYHTSQYVHRSADEGHSWEVISPDLSTNNPEHQGYAGGPITRDGTGVEIYGTVFAFEESPYTAGELWAGTDDGRLHVSRDNGGSWTEITPSGMPAGATINSIDISPHGEGRAFIAAYRYREADRTPYIYATDDHGASWRSLGGGIPSTHFVRVVREDPDRKGLLYAGTEYGIYVSLDDGASWESFQLNLPITPVTDIQVHNKDLVLATQGRSFWILDDLTPLHNAPEAATTEPVLVTPRTSTRLAGSGGFSLPGGRRATDAPKGVVFDYFLPGDHEGPVTITIKDSNGETVQEFSSEPPPGGSGIPEVFLILAEVFGIDIGGKPVGKSPGHNRFLWNMTYKAPRPPAMIFGFPSGAIALPGTYEATLTVGETSTTQSFEIVNDPRSDASMEDMRAQLEFLQDVEERIATVAEELTTLRSVRTQAQEAGGRVSEAIAAMGDDVDPEIKERAEQVKAAVESIVTNLTEVEGQLAQVKSRSFEDPLNYPGKLVAQLANLHAVVNGGNDAAPTAASVERLGDLDVELEAVYSRLDEILDSEVASLNVLVNGIELPAVVLDRD